MDTKNPLGLAVSGFRGLPRITLDLLLVRWSEWNHYPAGPVFAGFPISCRPTDTVTDTVSPIFYPQKIGGGGVPFSVYLLATLFFEWNSGTMEQNRSRPRLAWLAAVPRF